MALLYPKEHASSLLSAYLCPALHPVMIPLPHILCPSAGSRCGAAFLSEFFEEEAVEEVEPTEDFSRQGQLKPPGSIDNKCHAHNRVTSQATRSVHLSEHFHLQPPAKSMCKTCSCISGQ